MSENEVVDLLNFMMHSIQLIQERFLKINVPDEFILSSEGITVLDSITMRLQVIGESVKKIQKINPSILNRYTEIEWNKISKLRDLVSHHYEEVDHEIVYDICENHIPKLKQTLVKISNETNNN